MKDQSTLMLPAPSAAPPVIGQALLFSPEIETLVKQEEDASGVYTAERFKVRREHDYQAVIQLLGRGKGMLAIAKLLGCHHKTVAAVRDSEPESIDIVRSKRVSQILTAVDLQIERLIENPGLVPFNVAGLLISQLIDKAELLDGRATQRVEKVERVDIYAEWEEVLEKHLQPGEVREIGLVDGNKSAIEAPVLDADRADIDAESTDSAPVATERATTDPALPTTEGPNERASEPPDARNSGGGRGSASQPGGGLTQLGSKERNFSGNGPLPAPPI